MNFWSALSSIIWAITTLLVIIVLFGDESLSDIINALKSRKP